MYTFRKRIGRKNKWENHHVYDEEEANEIGLTYVKDWKKVKPMEWALTNDGYVAQCKKIDTYKAQKRLYTFFFGQMWYHDKAKLFFKPHWDNKSFSGTSTKNWIERLLHSKTGKRMIYAYAMAELQGTILPPEKLEKILFPKGGKDRTWAVKRILKSKEFKTMITEQVKEALSDREIDEGKVIDMILEATETAKNKDDASNMMRGAENLRDLLDMKPKQESTTRTLEIGSLKEIEGRVALEENKLKLSEKTEGRIEDDEETMGTIAEST